MKCQVYPAFLSVEKVLVTELCFDLLETHQLLLSSSFFWVNLILPDPKCLSRWTNVKFCRRNSLLPAPFPFSSELDSELLQGARSSQAGPKVLVSAASWPKASVGLFPMMFVHGNQENQVAMGILSRTKHTVYGTFHALLSEVCCCWVRFDRAGNAHQDLPHVVGGLGRAVCSKFPFQPGNTCSMRLLQMLQDHALLLEVLCQLSKLDLRVGRAIHLKGRWPCM